MPEARGNVVEFAAGLAARRSEEGWDQEGGLWVYRNPTVEGAESTWTDLDADEKDTYFKRGALAHAVSEAGLYGARSTARFAGCMRVALSTVHDWLSTYRRLLRLAPDRRERVLSLDLSPSHYRACNAVRDDVTYEALLKEAHDGRYLVGALAANAQRERDAERRSEPPTLPPDAPEPCGVDEDPPGPSRAPHDPLRRDRELLSGFVEWLREGPGVRLVDADGVPLGMFDHQGHVDAYLAGSGGGVTAKDWAGD